MRSLLVDNYDSFTYNLFHFLAEVNGTEPVVIRNDEPGWHPETLDEFDNVVLSPGPGTPHRRADFGLCAEIAEQGRLPVLGVCLGHQGMALAHGGTVRRAPEPRHGRSSLVHHDGTELFEGLPMPLEVIRYHSLAVTDVPEDIQVTATSTDGVVMGLRHSLLPLWGVQFHPESIGTEEGHRLLANFRDLTELYRYRHGMSRRPSSTTIDLGPAARLSRPQRMRELRVLAERLVTRWDPEVAFDRLFRTGYHPFWLDSSQVGAPLGELSIMGDASGPLARVAKADVVARTVTVSTAYSTRVLPTEFLGWLDADLRSMRVDAPELPFDFTLGWVGYLGYELKAECDGELAHRSTEPDAAMVFADHGVVFDHRTGHTYLLALVEDGDEESARDWLRTAAETLAGVEGRGAGPAPAPGPAGGVPVRLRHDRTAYLDLIDNCYEQIRAGETYEVCLTNMIEAEAQLDPWQAYRFLRRVSPAPFAAYLGFGDVSVLSTSPERFLRIDRHGMMESKPIKGTRPRGSTPQEDALLVADLATSEKDRAENLMIVDLVRNDLGRCAEIGSVVADPVFQVETYATVHQLVSTVRARLRPEVSAVDGVRSAFPGGSMTGAPKIRTMQIIDQLESGPRGVYSGAIGYFSLTGAADLSIVIRTVVLNGNHLRYGVGGAIVALSDSDDEFEETAVKAKPLLMLLGAEFPERQPATSRTAS